jgi:hypothetical protein
MFYTTLLVLPNVVNSKLRTSQVEVFFRKKLFQRKKTGSSGDEMPIFALRLGCLRLVGIQFYASQIRVVSC